MRTKPEKIIQNFCIWTDLLGFGNAFEEGEWSLQNSVCRKNLERLHRLEISLHQSNDPSKEVAFVLNDGLARVYDLPEYGNDAMRFLWWLHSALSNHWLLNRHDIQYGNPGARSVMTFGDRVSSWREHTTFGDCFFGSPERKKLADKKICIYSPEEFQLNLAFSKAYIIETSGTKGGLPGPNMYIDKKALDAIESYLCHNSFLHLMPNGSEDYGDHGVLNFKKVLAYYEITKTIDSDALYFNIYRIIENIKHKVMSLQFFSSPIKFNKRGITTEIYHLKKYFPLDELDEKTHFFFDYDNYC
ncbi:hypothetical protein [Methylomonas sp. DH-1]|uniref:hypothetical protein n=1 Tax=Methylomonas sp. (strain DH-1) TaxID=1727196 RepID=UPI0012F686FF|nr:hypothetical protein [Methylomonas sp. DH-1]